ncbi:MAG: hypothetical protein FMNOHCHN_01024 [Ignavibacteriaceae bacterium]|nr:hypothetical protein [Ignavibacteriaceae bacterium]
MKQIIYFLVVILSSTAPLGVLYAQSAGDYRSALTGQWGSAATWEIYNGTAWVPAAAAPAGSENITVKDTVSTGVAAILISGYTKVEGNGVITVGDSGSVTFTPSATYEHARNAGTLPMSTWQTGSLAKFTGITGTAPGNRIQSFSRIIWDNPGQTANLNMGWNNVTITGDIIINNTGTGRWYFAGPTTGSTAEFIINGDIYHNGGNFATHGTGNGNTTIIVHHFGNITAIAGNFSITRGSQAGTGTTTWYLHGDLTLTNVETQNSNPAGAKFVIAGEEFQNISLTNVTFSGGGLPITVDSAGVANLGSSLIAGNGAFTVSDFGGVITSHPDGFNGNLTTLGAINFSPRGYYGFMGTVPQVTGSLMQDTVGGIYIENTSGVTLSGNVIVEEWVTISKGSIIPGVNQLTYGNNVRLSYEGDTPVTTSDVEFPSTGGPRHLRVINEAGVTLHADRTVNGEVTIEKGNLLLNGKTLTLGPDAELEEFGNAVVSGSSGKIVTIRTLSAPSGSNPGGLGAIITSSANLGSTLIERYHDARTGNNHQGIKRIYRIAPANNTGLNAVLRFSYADAELNAIPENNLVLFSSEDGQTGWQLASGIRDTQYNYYEVTGINSFSWHTLGDIFNQIPVELTSFTAANQNGKTMLRWVTASETGNKGWDIEVYTGSWNTIGFVAGAGYTAEQRFYEFTDETIRTGLVKYRLRQIDYDGSFNYSSEVVLEAGLPSVFSLEQNYPNPFNPSTTIRFSLPSGLEKSPVTLKIYDVTGKFISEIYNSELESGYHQITFEAAGLASGMYIYRLTAGEVILTKSMMLIK